MERKARSMREFDPFGLTCVYDGTTCSRENEYKIIICEKGDDGA